MSNYIIELSVVHLSLTLAYWLFMRKERQYGTMRFYLLVSVIVSLAVPLFKLPRLFNSEATVDALPAVVLAPGHIPMAATDEHSIWSIDLLAYVYVAISVVFLCRLVANVLALIKLRRKSYCERIGDLHVHNVPGSKTSFSFFRWIFIGDDISKNDPAYQVMLEHEKAHAVLGHSYDIFFLKLFHAFFWWLPTAWMVNREIRRIHEYQADAYVLKSFSLDDYSSILISSSLKLNGIGLVSSFDDSLILKRLTAMKQQTKKVSAWKLGALTAFCAALFMVFACTEDNKSGATNAQSDKNNDVFVIVEQMPEVDGGLAAFNSRIKDAISYPAEALNKRISGRVDVQFVVDKDGSLSDVKVISGIGAGCDEEAVKAVKNAPSFKPGSQNGKPVRVAMLVPIQFSIDESSSATSAQGSVSVLPAQAVNFKFKVDASYRGGEWSGVVNDEQGEGLPGVNILVVGTTTGTVTDEQGKFRLQANESNDLNLSFVGYESVKLAAREN